MAYVVVLGSITLGVFAITPFVSSQVDSFADDWPEFKIELAESIEGVSDELEDRFGVRLDTTQVTCLLDADEGTSVSAPSQQTCDEVTKDFRDRIADQAGRLTEIGSSVLHVLFIFFVAPIIAAYLLIDLPQLGHDMLNLVPQANREEVADLGSKIGRTVGGFFRGQLVVALIVGVMASIGFFAIDLRFWLIIGAIAGLTNLIPLVGPFIGGGLGFIVGTLTDGIGKGLAAAGIALLVQQIDNHLISPNVMKRAVALHPVTVMLSLIAGGTLAGFWGVLLGVPMVAVLKLLLNHLWTTRVLGMEVGPYTATSGTTPPSVVPEPQPVVVGTTRDEGAVGTAKDEGDKEPSSKDPD